jgi:hypothetical protein
VFSGGGGGGGGGGGDSGAGSGGVSGSQGGAGGLGGSGLYLPGGTGGFGGEYGVTTGAGPGGGGGGGYYSNESSAGVGGPGAVAIVFTIQMNLNGVPYIGTMASYTSVPGSNVINVVMTDGTKLQTPEQPADGGIIATEAVVNGIIAQFYGDCVAFSSGVKQMVSPYAVQPTVTSMIVAGNGTTLTVNFSSAVSCTSSAGLTFTDGTTYSLSYVSGSGSTSLVFTIGTTVNFGDSCTVSYASGSGNIVASGVGYTIVASFTNYAVTNNSTQNQSMLGAGSPIGLLLALTYAT